MKDLKIPEGYQQIMPYLIVENAAEFLKFTRNVFDAAEKTKVMRTETLIMHAEVSIGNSIVMVADVTEQYKKQTANLFIYVDDCDSIYQKALANGATSVSEPANQEYGRSAGVCDPFGITWWLTAV